LIQGFLLFNSFLLAYGAINTLDIRDTTYYLKATLNAPSHQEISTLKITSLVQKFSSDESTSLSEQISARIIFCSNFKGYHVITDNINYHPICLVDAGSYDFSGWGSASVDLFSLPKDQGLIIISDDLDKLQALKSQSTKDFIKIKNIVIFEKSILD
jgi:hypothetical protein